MQVSKEVQFDAGHRVARHGGKCSSPHGHRYRVVLTVQGPIVDDDDRGDFGMVMDFGAIKEFLTRDIHDVLDHAFIVEASDIVMRQCLENGDDRVREQGDQGWRIVVVPFTPTAEELARHIAALATNALDGMVVTRVDVWETPTSVATWTRDNQ